MNHSSSSPRDESAQPGPGEGEAEVIAFPQAPAPNTPARPLEQRAWPGQLIDLQMARAMAGDHIPDTPLDGTELPEDSTPQAVPQDVTARSIALRTLAARARTEAELRQKLADRGIESDTIDGVMAGLASEGLIDDARLATDLAQTLQESKKMGPVAIRQALIKRRVPRGIIDEVIGGLAEADATVLEDLARARMRVLEGLDRDVQVRRLVGYLARRGYQGSDVYRVVDQVVGRG